MKTSNFVVIIWLENPKADLSLGYHIYFVVVRSRTIADRTNSPTSGQEMLYGQAERNIPGYFKYAQPSSSLASPGLARNIPGHPFRNFPRCYRCGNAFSHNHLYSCPALRSECFKCGKFGHFARMCFPVPSSTVFSDRSPLRINRTNAENLSAGVDRTISQSDGLSYTIFCCTAQSSVEERSTKQQCKKSKTAAKRRRDAGRIKEFMERKKLAQLFPYFETSESEFRLLTSKNATSEQIGVLERKKIELKNNLNVLQKEITDRKNVQTAERCIQTDTLNSDNVNVLQQKKEKLKSESNSVRKTLHEERQCVKNKNIEISKLQRELKVQKTNSVQKPAATKQTSRTSTGRNNVTRRAASFTGDSLTTLTFAV